MEHTADPAYYEIHVAGRLGPEWADWFEGLSITPGPDGATILAGLVVDQAALHGHLARVRDLALPLIAVRRRPPRGP
jgi:hypothetical protein